MGAISTGMIILAILCILGLGIIQLNFTIKKEPYKVPLVMVFLLLGSIVFWIIVGWLFG